MPTILSILTHQFTQTISTLFPEIPKASLTSLADIARNSQEQFGHYQCNAAMKLGKMVKKNPRQIAEAIVSSLHQSLPDKVEKLEIAGPGFINITIRGDYLAKRIEQSLHDSHLGMDKPVSQRIVIDFSSPNIAKEMHVGHLRSSIIGDCLARIFEFLGHNVLRLNHLGDWGTQFGMLIAHMKETAPKVLLGQEETDLTHLVGWYRTSKQRFDNDSDFKRRSQQEVVSLQKGETQALKAWQIICSISEKAYQEIYDILDIQLIDRGESFYNPFLPEIVADLEKKGLITLSDGAKCLFLEGFTNREGAPLPMMVQKSDGGYNYDTTDLAAMRHRIEVEKADRIIIVTDAGQSLHFQMLVKASEKAGYLDPTKVRFDHVPFGVVLGNDGKKFKTRSGETERLKDLLETAVEQARHILQEREMDLTAHEKETLAQALGIGAVKYADLSCHRVGDYLFSYDRMLRFEGNTAAFLMYSYVRVAGIKRKVKTDVEALIHQKYPINLSHPSETKLALHLAQLGEIIDTVAEELLPNRLTDYLYELAQKFNLFFRDCRVEGSPEEKSRLLLCEATARTLRTGFNLLGIRSVERM